MKRFGGLAKPTMKPSQSAYAASSPKGRAFLMHTTGFPLRGSCHEVTDEVFKNLFPDRRCRLKKNHLIHRMRSPCPVAVPEKIRRLTLFFDFFDRCHSLGALYLPLAALSSLPPQGEGILMHTTCATIIIHSSFFIIHFIMSRPAGMTGAHYFLVFLVFSLSFF